MPKDYEPSTITGIERISDVVVICDHASNLVPPVVAGGDLGLPVSDMSRHIAYDIGARGVSLRLGEALGAPVICSNFSRLVIDPNRGEDDPTLMMRLCDGTIIPGNRHADEAELQRRLNLFYRPYHAALASLIASRNRPMLVSIHSFTPKLRSRHPRPWHIGILSGRDRRLSDPLLRELAAEGDLCIGDNQPYTGDLKGDCMDRHAIEPGRLNTLIEIRHDLIDTANGEARWASRLAPLLQRAISAVTVAA